MREILFRGKIEKGEWVQGDLFKVFEDGHFIHDGRCHSVKVIPETIGQYTGLTDKNGTKIFEDDIVNCISSDIVGNPKYAKIIVKDMTDYNTMVYLNISDELEVIGNIHDDPELLGGVDE